MQENTNERFKNRMEALNWLQSRGQISRGKFYDDCKIGKITIYPDKTVSRASVFEYAETVFEFARKGPVLTGCPLGSGCINTERLLREVERLCIEVGKLHNEIAGQQNCPGLNT